MEAAAPDALQLLLLFSGSGLRSPSRPGCDRQVGAFNFSVVETCKDAPKTALHGLRPSNSFGSAQSRRRTRPRELVQRGAARPRSCLGRRRRDAHAARQSFVTNDGAKRKDNSEERPRSQLCRIVSIYSGRLLPTLRVGFLVILGILNGFRHRHPHSNRVCAHTDGT